MENKTMYDKQVKLFRYCAETNCNEYAVAGCPGPQKFLKEAADAIDGLWNEVKAHRMRYGWVDSENEGQDDG